jgi:hypothetical protein
MAKKAKEPGGELAAGLGDLGDVHLVQVKPNILLGYRAGAERPVCQITFFPEKEEPCCPQCGQRVVQDRGCLFCDSCGWTRRLTPEPRRRLGLSEVAGLSKWGKGCGP